jgi:hypothetical protein
MRTSGKVPSAPLGKFRFPNLKIGTKFRGSQDVISRLANSSFLLKGWSVMLVARATTQ